MTTLDTYARFLTARWDEMEAVSRAAIHDDRPDDGVWRIDNLGIDEGERIDGQGIIIYAEGGHNAAQADHIVLHDPACVLADLAAKRAVLFSAQSTALANEGAEGDLALSLVSRGVARGMFEAVKHLAAPFRDHPDHPENEG